MDPKFNGLPPHKRLRLIHQQEQQPAFSCLPAKKRTETTDPPALPDPKTEAIASYRLPAKKRVWALPPDLIPQKPQFDLNADYKEEEEANVQEAKVVVEEEEVEEENIGEEKVVKEENVQEEKVVEEENVQEEKVVEEENVEEKVVEEDDGIVCAVCESTDGEPSDPIVICDGCDLMVHVSCYGNPLTKEIPEGDWFCTQCSDSDSKSCENDKSFSCCLCPVKGGAMKPTGENGKWAHVVCALFVPEVFFRDPEGREGIDCSKVPQSRWEHTCYLCKTTNGCSINCSEPKCRLAFHVTCGLNEDLCIEYREGKKKGAIVAGFCKTHTDLWKKQERTGKFKIVARED